jgi:hypothetical protein
MPSLHSVRCRIASGVEPGRYLLADVVTTASFVVRETDRVPMTSFDENTQAFIVRFWRERREIEAAMPEWRGVVEHVRSGDRRYLKSFEELVQFIARHLSQVQPEN